MDFDLDFEDKDECFMRCACCLRKLNSQRPHQQYFSTSGPGYGLWYRLCHECDDWCDRDIEW